MKNKLNFNRRGFLKSTMLGTAGTLLGTKVLGNGHFRISEQPVIRRQLGKTDIELPVVSYGVMRSDNPGIGKVGV